MSRQIIVPLCLLTLLACADSAAPPEEAPAEPAPVEAVEAAAEAEPAQATVALKARLDLNTASEDEFVAGVPGLGKKMAHEFEEYRPYASVSQFRKEMGKYVDDATIAAYLEHVYVPIAFNECDAATLMQLDLTAEAADALMQGRPYADKAAFVDALKTHASPEVVSQRSAWIVGS